MLPISIHVAEPDYVALKALAARRGRPVAELVREAMARYLHDERRHGESLATIPAHHSGKLRRRWRRSGLLDEMRGA
jgi:hypothetical protein